MPRRVRAEAVAESLRRLKEQKVHRTFAGYLSLKRAATAYGSTDNLESRAFKDFFEAFLRVSDATEQKPYFVPFSDSATSDANRWFNRNVAGSYAPSSLRPVSPFRRVVRIEGLRYSLADRHWESALQHLALGTRVPVLPLSTFLYRDYTFLGEEPTAADLLSVFREEFGYTIASFETADEEYHHLYYEDEDINMNSDWFTAV